MKLAIIDSESTSYKIPSSFELAGTATSLAAGHKIIQTSSPDILLINVNLLTQLPDDSMLAKVPYIIALANSPDPELLRVAMSIKSRDLLIKPIQPEKFNEALANAVKNIAKEKQQQSNESSVVEKSTVISVCGPKGGVGKSTIAVNLACLLRKETQKKVVLLDLVPQFGCIPIMLDIEPETTLDDIVAEGDYKNSNAIEKYLTFHISGIKVLAGPQNMSDITADLISTLLDNLKTAYDYIIIDTEGSFDEITNQVLDLSSLVLLAMDISIPTIRNVSIALDNLKALYYTKDKVKLIINQVNSSKDLSPAEISKHLDWPVTAVIPENKELIVNSINSGVPFIISQPTAEASNQIREIAKIFAKDQLIAISETIEKPKKRGLFAKK